MKTILIDAVNTFIIKGVGVNKQMHALLEEYANRKIILTGANDEQFKIFGLDKVPYEVFTLKHSPEKTDPKYYRLMLEHFSLKPKDVIYFEHDEGAVRSAKSAGILTFHYDKDRKDLRALKAFINENL